MDRTIFAAIAISVVGLGAVFLSASSGHAGASGSPGASLAPLEVATRGEPAALDYEGGVCSHAPVIGFDSQTRGGVAFRAEYFPTLEGGLGAVRVYFPDTDEQIDLGRDYALWRELFRRVP